MPNEIIINASAGETRVALLGTDLGSGGDAFRRLDAKLILICGKVKNPRARIDAGGRVPHRDVIRCLDSFLLAGETQVDFVGVPPRRAR